MRCFCPPESRAPPAHDRGVVALRQVEDHLVRAGLLGRGDHRRRRRARPACGRCSRRRCRRTARRPAAGSRCSCRARRARSASSAAPSSRTAPEAGPPDAGQHPRERRLARGRGADHAERLAGLRAVKSSIAQARLLLLGRDDGELVDLEHARAGGAGRSAVACSGVLVEQRLEVGPALAGAQHQRPAADRLLDRRQRAAEQDRAGDHRAGASSRPAAPDRRRGRASPTAGRSGRSWTSSRTG